MKPISGLYDCLGEYESIDELNYLAELLDGLNKSEMDIFCAAVEKGEHSGSILTGAAHSCFPTGQWETCSTRPVLWEGGYLMKQKTAAFRVDGYEISATFAESRNSDISRHLKHILLTSYAADTPKKCSGGILEVPAAQRYNDSGERHRVP